MSSRRECPHPHLHLSAAGAVPLEEDLHRLLQPILSARDTVTLSCIHNVTPQLQIGAPMCGLVALSMAAELLFGSCPQSACADNLLDVAIQHSLSKKGELLSVTGMLSLVKPVLPMADGSIISATELTPAVLLSHVISQKALLVPYDCDKDHAPCLANGHRAHWCLVVGAAVHIKKDLIDQKFLSICKKDRVLHNLYHLPEHTSEGDPDSLLHVSEAACGGDVYVFARHGKSRHLGLWRLDELLQSNANLMELDPSKSPDQYVVPSEGLSSALASQLVLLQKNE